MRRARPSNKGSVLLTKQENEALFSYLGPQNYVRSKKLNVPRFILFLLNCLINQSVYNMYVSVRQKFLFRMSIVVSLFAQ